MREFVSGFYCLHLAPPNSKLTVKIAPPCPPFLSFFNSFLTSAAPAPPKLNSPCLLHSPHISIHFFLLVFPLFFCPTTPHVLLLQHASNGPFLQMQTLGSCFGLVKDEKKVFKIHAETHINI